MEKVFKGYLILNWKNGRMEVKKRKPKKSKLSPFDIPIKLNITIEIPEREEIVLSGKIQLSKEQVKRMVLEKLGENE